MGNSHLSAWFLLHYYSFGIRIYDFGFFNPKSTIRIWVFDLDFNPQSTIRNPKSLYLKFGIGQSPDEKWDSGVS